MAHSRRRKSPKPSATPTPISAADLISAVTDSMPAVPPSGGVEAPSSPPGTTYKRLPPTSVVRAKAMDIISMRHAGLSTEEIAKKLDIKPRSVIHYMYLAGRNGWLATATEWANPEDRLEYELSHKVVRNLEKALDDEYTQPIGKDSATIAVAKGTLFKKFDQHQAAPQAHSNMLAVRIEVVNKAGDAAVQDTVDAIASGTPRYLDGEVDNASRLE